MLNQPLIYDYYWNKASPSKWIQLPQVSWQNISYILKLHISTESYGGI